MRCDELIKPLRTCRKTAVSKSRQRGSENKQRQNTGVLHYVQDDDVLKPGDSGLLDRFLDVFRNMETIELTGDDLLHFIFDRNEPYRAPFSEQWHRELNAAETAGTSSIWQLIQDVTEGRANVTPGLQAADMWAWALNRENLASIGQHGTGLAEVMRALIPSSRKVYDEDALRREYGAPQHLR